MYGHAARVDAKEQTWHLLTLYLTENSLNLYIKNKAEIIAVRKSKDTLQETRTLSHTLILACFHTYTVILFN